MILHPDPAVSLLIIDPTIEVPDEEGIEIFLKFWPGRHDLLRPAINPADRGRLVGLVSTADAIVLLGTKASVHDDHDWQKSLTAALEPVLNGANPLPLLAICYGHQLVALEAGGGVGFLNEDLSKRSGVETTRFSGSRFFADTTLRSVVSHQEVVSVAPPGYAVVACRSGVTIDALEHLTLPIFTTQFHPEARAAFAGRQGIPLSEIDDTVKADGDRLISSFLKMSLAYRAG